MRPQEHKTFSSKQGCRFLRDNRAIPETTTRYLGFGGRAGNWGDRWIGMKRLNKRRKTDNETTTIIGGNAKIENTSKQAVPLPESKCRNPQKGPE